MRYSMRVQERRVASLFSVGVGFMVIMIWVGLEESSLQLLDNRASVLVGLGLAAKIAGKVLALGEGVEDGLLDAVGVLVERHVPQHHDGRKKESGGVSEALAGNVGGGTVDGLEDGALITDVAGGSKTKTTNQTSAHVGENVTVQVGHDEDLVVVRERVGGHLEAGVVEELLVELDTGELLGDLTAGLEEETVGKLHDSSLVNDADLLAADGLGLLESKTKDTLGSLTSDELDGLDDTIDDDVLNARVLALGVLTDQNSVDVVVRGLETGDGTARSQVGEEVECAAEGKVEGDVTLANGGSKRTLEGDLVLLDVLDRGIRNGGLAILDDRGDVDGLPGDGGLHMFVVSCRTMTVKRQSLTFAAAKMSLTDWEISGPIPSPSIRETRKLPCSNVSAGPKKKIESCA